MNNRRKQLMLASAKEYCKCVVEGKTIKYNQIVKNGNFNGTSEWTSSTGTFSASDNICSFDATAQNGDIRTIVYYDIVVGHKYLVYAEIKTTTATNNGVALYFGYSSPDRIGYVPSNTEWNAVCGIKQATSQGNSYLVFIRDFRASNRDTIYIKNVMCIDLTALGLDNINSIADFYETDLGKYILKGNYLLYEPNGKFIHAQSPINFEGVNIWNEQWQGGAIWYHGTKIESSGYANYMCCKTKIKVRPNTRYFYHCVTNDYIQLEYLDKDSNYISREIKDNNSSFITPINCYYIVFYINDTYGGTYHNDICINEYNENYNGKYQKYCGTKTYYEPLTYNQLVQNGNFASTENWSLNGCTLSVLNNVGTLTITANANSNGIETGIQLGGYAHRYALVFNASASRPTIMRFSLGGSSIAGIEEYIHTNEEQFKFIFYSDGDSINTLRMFVNANNLFLQNGDKVYLSNFMVIDLTKLYGAGNEPTSVNELNETDVGKAIDNGEYLPYSVSNDTYYIGGWDMYKGCVWKSWNGQLTKTMTLINLDNLSWASEEIGMVAQLPSNFKTFEYDELASVIAEKYETAKYNDEILDSICIADIYGYGYSIIIRYGSTQPSGFALFELATPTTETVTTRMVSRRTINVESDNGVDLVFTKE